MPMQNDYYQNILYPLQDKVLGIIGKLPVDFYLTGGTALSRAYLQHRYSDDLDFFVNNAPDFKKQVSDIIKVLEEFPVEKIHQISWINEPPTNDCFQQQVDQIITDILEGADNSLFR